MTGRNYMRICSALFCASALFLSACSRPIGGLETTACLETVSPADGIRCAGAGPLAVYTGAELDLLMPLADYSWERKYPPELVMLHFTSAVVEHRDDPYNETYLRELFTGQEVSTHYLIDRDGTIHCYVPEDRVAWHAGAGEWLGDPRYTNNMNEYAIGIELAAIGSETDMEKYLPAEEYAALDPALPGFTGPQYDALADLVADLCARYGIPLDENHVIGHDAYSPEKNDPGELFDWSRILPEEAAE